MDSMVLDCDGVLIDTHNSYDATIVAVVDQLIRSMFGVILPWRSGAPRLIQGLRNTGGFNNDWDTVYAITLFAACAMPAPYAKRFVEDVRTRRPRVLRIPRAGASRILARVGKTVRAFGRKKSSAGSVSVEEYLRSLASDKRELCDRVQGFLRYPGNPPSSMLASLFDETYHGRRLYREMYGAEPRYYLGRGLIEDDEVIVRRSDLSALSRMVSGKLALATGRPKRAAEYSLGKLMSFFKPEASVFVGDADLESASDMGVFRKPSGRSLLLAESKFRSKQLVYVGDSAEDWQMVLNARRLSSRIAFAGIYGTSYDPAGQVRFFKREGAELILPAVRDMPAVIEEVGRN